MEWIARALLVTIVASLITSSIGVAPVVAGSPPAASDPVSPATITPEALKAANAVASPPAPSASPVVVGSCAGTLFEENDQAVTYMWGGGRGWTEWSDPAATAGHYIADDPQLFASGPSGATATFYFTGNCVSWNYIATPYSGSISVT